MRVAYLGPAGTHSEGALRAATDSAGIEAEPRATIFAAIEAVAEGEVELAFVPFENSIEGTVRPTLDALAFDTTDVRIVGEFDHAISHALIAREGIAREGITTVLSHPQAAAQCARYLREQLPQAEVLSVSSTSDAVRQVSLSEQPWAALASADAAAGYGCAVLAEGVEDASGNVTRFVWLSRGTRPPAEVPQGASWRTTLVFFELGDDHPGALVDALAELSRRGINMTRIESRPRRIELGRYLFFIDLDGRAEDPTLAEGIEALRDQAEIVRVLGSYPTAAGHDRG